MDLEQFKKDRNHALLSLDGPTIIAYFEKYNGTAPEVNAIFWMGIHKARTACRELPMEARSLSKRWLMDRGFQPMDDGEVLLLS